jgi:hypothetical protein
VQPHPVPSLTDEQRAVLQMLAMSPRGYSLPTVMAGGFACEMLQHLVRTGLASVQRDLVGMEKTKIAHGSPLRGARRSRNEKSHRLCKMRFRHHCTVEDLFAFQADAGQIALKISCDRSNAASNSSETCVFWRRAF